MIIQNLLNVNALIIQININKVATVCVQFCFLYLNSLTNGMSAKC